MHDDLRPLHHQTLRGGVVDTIRRAILDGVLQPGDQVNQLQIAEKLGVSRGPVREALGQLEEEGLIRNIPYKGTFVTEITPAYIGELYGIRRVLEGFAIQRVAERGAEPQPALGRIVEQMRSAADAGEQQLAELDIAFHAEICISARHVLLLQMWKGIEIGVRRCLALRHRFYHDPREILGTHPHILAALEAGDAAEAGRLLDQHIREAGELLLRSWQQAESEAPDAPAPGVV